MISKEDDPDAFHTYKELTNTLFEMELVDYTERDRLYNDALSDTPQGFYGRDLLAALSMLGHEAKGSKERNLKARHVIVRLAAWRCSSRVFSRENKL